MKTSPLLLSLGAALLLGAPALPAQDPSPASAPEAGVKVGSKVGWLADWTLPLATGGELRFAELLPKERKPGEKPETRFIVLTFWSCKCPWQIAWDPEFIAIQKEYGPKGVKVVAVDSNKPSHESLEEIQARLRKAGINFPVALDKGNKLADLFQAQTTPHVFLIDHQGRVLYTGAPNNYAYPDRVPKEKREAWLRDALDAALAGKEIHKASTRPQGCSIKRERKVRS